MCCADCDIIDWFRDLAEWKKFLIVISAIIFIVSMFLIGYSVTILVPLNYGLLKDNNAVQIDTDDLWKSGRHFTGLGFDFIEFPRTIQYLTFSDNLIKDSEKEKDVKEKSSEVASEAGSSEYNEKSKKFNTITARTKEGLKIYFDVYVGYKLTTANDDQGKVSQLFAIYSNFGYDWNKFLSLIINSVVRDTLMEFESLDIPQSRELIGNKLFENIKQLIYDFHFELIQFNVVNVQFPEEVDAAISRTEIVSQTKDRMDYVKLKTEIEADTNLEMAKIEVDIIKSEAEIKGYKYLIEKSNLAKTYAETMKIIADNLDFATTGTPPTQYKKSQQCLDFLWIYGMKENDSKRVIIETTKPTIQ